MDEKKIEEAVAALKAGHFEKALKQFNALLERRAEDPDMFSYRGAVLLNLNRKREALADFDRAVSLDPGYSYRYASRAFAKDALGDLPGAIADYEKAIELDPDDAIAHNNLGLLIEKSGDQSRAKKHFSSADELARTFFGDDLDDDGAKPESGIAMQPQKLTPDPKKVSGEMYWSQLGRIFTSRAERKKFFQFILNGFKKRDA